MNKLEQELTPQEIASIKEIQIKKNHIEHHPMDLSKVFDHGESSDDESCDEETQLFFVDNWYIILLTTCAFIETLIKL